MARRIITGKCDKSPSGEHLASIAVQQITARLPRPLPYSDVRGEKFRNRDKFFETGCECDGMRTGRLCRRGCRKSSYTAAPAIVPVRQWGGRKRGAFLVEGCTTSSGSGRMSVTDLAPFTLGLAGRAWISFPRVRVAFGLKGPAHQHGFNLADGLRWVQSLRANVGAVQYRSAAK